MTQSHETHSSSEPPWLGEMVSPYGLSDEDATLRQADSARWRTLFGGRSKRFVPVQAKPRLPEPSSGIPVSSGASASSSRSLAVNRMPGGKSRVTSLSLSSMILGQALVTLILCLALVYLVKSQTRDASLLHTFFHTMERQDYSHDVMPALKHVLQQVHLTSLGMHASATGTAAPRGTL